MGEQKIVAEGMLTYQFCQFENGIDGYKLDGEWLADTLDKVMGEQTLKAVPDDGRYIFTIPYCKVRITVERIESE